MKFWRYTFQSPQGLVKGRIGAEDEDDAKRRLRSMGVNFQKIEYINPAEEAEQIPKGGKEIPLGSLPSNPPPPKLSATVSPPAVQPSLATAKLDPLDPPIIAPSFKTLNLEVPKEAPQKIRRERLLYDEPEKVTYIVNDLLEKHNGKVKLVDFTHNVRGKVLMAAVVEYDAFEEKEKKENAHEDDSSHVDSGNGVDAGDDGVRREEKGKS